MKRYFKIYFALMKINFTILLTYRMNFLNSVISSSAWGIFSIVSILIITSRTGTVFGWKRTDLILLTASYGLLIGVFHTIFSRNFERFARVMSLGQFDSILLKPIDSQFALSFWLIHYGGFIRILLGIVILAYLLISGSYAFSFVSVFLFVVLLLIGVVLLYCVWFLVATLLIWIPELSNLISLLYDVSGISRYPPEMFKRISGFILFILLPIVIITSVPLRVLIGKASILDVLILLFTCVLFLLLSRTFWKRALKSYSSASN